jgi:tRNA A37 threonylcarbamoyladenosine synthetase subunit TsaC/SUA5/YrdC
VCGFLRFPPPIKLTGHNITEILLRVTFNTISLTLLVIVAKPVIETSAVIVEDEDESYDPGSAPYIPSQPQFSSSQTFTGVLNHLRSGDCCLMYIY